MVRSSGWLGMGVEEVFRHKAKSQGKGGSAFNIAPPCIWRKTWPTKTLHPFAKTFCFVGVYSFQVSLKLCHHWEIFLNKSMKWGWQATARNCRLPSTGEVGDYQKVSKRWIKMSIPPFISSPPTHTPTNKPASFELKEEFISEYRSEWKSFNNGPTVSFENNAIS